MASLWQHGIGISVFGESHSEAIGVVIDHLPPGYPIDMEEVQRFMVRRQAKSDGTTTSRVEPDIPHVLSGLHDGTTNGTPLCMVIQNTNTRSKDYSNLAVCPRPGHADYTGFVRYAGANDIRGGGHFSGRLTACLVAAGAVCAQILESRQIYSAAHLKQVHHIESDPLDTLTLTPSKLQEIRSLPFPVIDPEKRQAIIDCIQDARLHQDSVGGTVECVTLGMPAGIGSPMFDSIESVLSSLLFGIPGVKGVLFGNGTQCVSLYGSENNDAFFYDEQGKVQTKTNRHGGILGGITSGMPLQFEVLFKPTPSISKPQQSVNLQTGENVPLSIVGRHDPCIAVRAVPVVEACSSIALLGCLLAQPDLPF